MLARSARRFIQTVASESLPSSTVEAGSAVVETLSSGVRVAAQTAASERVSITLTLDSGSCNDSSEGSAHLFDHAMYQVREGVDSLRAGGGRRAGVFVHAVARALAAVAAAWSRRDGCFLHSPPPPLTTPLPHTPPPHHSLLQAKPELGAKFDQVGGTVTSTVGREQTSITATVGAADLEMAMAALAELTLGNSISADACESAKVGALADIASAEASADVWMVDQLHETAFQGGALGKPLRGSAAAVGALDAAALNAYAASNMVGSKMVLSAAGAVDASAVSSAAEKYFGSVASGAATTGPAPRYIGSDVRFREDDLGFAQVAVGVETVGWSDPAAVPMMVCQQILGDWDRNHPGGSSGPSILANGLGEEQLASKFSTFLHFYRGTGLFGVNMTTEDATLQDASYHVMQSFVRLQHLASESEVAYGKEKLKVALLAKPAGIASSAELMGEQITAFGRVVSAAELFARVEAVDVAAVQAAAYAYADSDHVLAAAGQLHELPSYDWFRNRTHWLAY